MRWTTRLKIVVTIALISVVVAEIVAAAYIDTKAQRTYAQEQVKRLDAASAKRYWRDAIEKNGAERAYAEFIALFALEHHSVRHNTAHLFGEVLYDEEGTQAISVCDQSFEFGCFHGFITRAVLREGLDALPELDDSCIARYGPDHHACQHGIGHGVLTSVGYDKLQKALDICMGLTWQGETGGCRGGVLMEYNFPLETDGEDFVTTVRPLTDDVYAPCNDVTEPHRGACIYELVQYWGRVYDHDFTVIDRLCSGYDTEHEKELCYKGAGEIAAPVVNYNTRKAVDLCLAFQTDIGQQECILQAAWSTTSHAEARKTAPEYCDFLTGQYAARCPTAEKINNL